MSSEPVIRVRQAKAEDAGAVAALIHQAGPDIYDYLFSGPDHARDFIAAECRSGRGFCGYRALLVATEGSDLVGVLCRFDAGEYGALQRGTLLDILTYCGVGRCWAVLARARHLAPVLSRPGPYELCLRNGAVAPEKRGKGIGSALFSYAFSEAKARGLRRIMLDVTENNPRARALYERMGFKPGQTSRCRNSRARMLVPASTRMVLDLDAY